MITQMEKNEILIRYKNGESIRSISKKLRKSRNTVRSYIRENAKLLEQLNAETDELKIAVLQRQLCEAPQRRIFVRNKRKWTSEIERRFTEIIEIYEKNVVNLGLTKQKLTAAKIHYELVKEGYDIGLSTVAEAFRKHKAKNKECFIRQEYEYGYRAEFDFHIVKLQVDGKVRKFHQVTIVAPKSDHIFELLYDNERTDVVVDSIIKFINECNGVFKTFVFDNTRTVVKQIFKNGLREYTDQLVSLSNYYGFKLCACNPRSGNEKGSVENGGKYTRNDIFSLKCKFSNMKELEEYHKTELDRINKKYQNEWLKELASLNKKPLHDYIVQTSSAVKVNSYSLICYNNNFYSVPDKLVGERVEINVIGNSIAIYSNNLLVASHKLKKGFHEYTIELSHYINTFMVKPSALEHSLALKQSPEELRKIFEVNYNKDARSFIKDLRDNCLKRTVSLTKCNSDEDEIGSISESQLLEITKIFGA